MPLGAGLDLDLDQDLTKIHQVFGYRSDLGQHLVPLGAGLDLDIDQDLTKIHHE